MLIDWLTLRTIITDLEEASLYPLMPYLAKLEVTNCYDQVIKTKLVVDIDQVRSDFQGMVWNISSNGKDKYLNIGASPAFLQNGNNLFGSPDYQYCKSLLINHAHTALTGALLIGSNWECRRIDITQNYFLESHTQVKDALHILRSSDGIRQKATVKGDSVYWGEGSSYRSGKAYDKFIQALELIKKSLAQGKPVPYTESQLHLMDSILRLELKLGRQYFDEHTDETLFTPDYLTNLHEDFFSRFIGSAEVTDMDKLLSILIETAPTPNRGRAAYDTYLRIKQLGYETASQTMPERTFYRHRKDLLNAGLSLSDLTTAKIIELRKRKINMQPVYDWAHLAELKKEAA